MFKYFRKGRISTIRTQSSMSRSIINLKISLAGVLNQSSCQIRRG